MHHAATNNRQKQEVEKSGFKEKEKKSMQILCEFVEKMAEKRHKTATMTTTTTTMATATTTTTITIATTTITTITTTTTTTTTTAAAAV